MEIEMSALEAHIVLEALALKAREDGIESRPSQQFRVRLWRVLQLRMFAEHNEKFPQRLG